MGKEPQPHMPFRFQECGAKTRRGTPCKGPAMKNGRCRLHGGKSPGAPKGPRNGNYKDGRRTNEMKALRKLLNSIAQDIRAGF